MTLKHLLQEITGRRLSPRKMEALRAEIGKTHEAIGAPGCLAQVGANTPTVGQRTVSTSESGDLVVRDTLLEYTQTPDVSRGRQVMHLGWYVCHEVQRTYNKDGLLVEKVVQDGNAYKGSVSTTTIKYEVPGDLFGKTERRPGFF